MLIEMKSPAFRKQGEERPPIHFKEGLNVVLGKEDGAMSIGKSSSLPVSYTHLDVYKRQASVIEIPPIPRWDGAPPERACHPSGIAV